jgi:hypothetical protein
MIKKPAKKLFGVLCGFLSRPKKDPLQLNLALYILFSTKKQEKSLTFEYSLEKVC